MEQIRKIIRKTLLESYLSSLNENLQKVTPDENDSWGKKTRIEGENWAKSMMEKGSGSTITIKQDLGKKLKTIAYAIELLLDAYKQGSGDYVLPTINETIQINKINIIDSITNAFQGVTDDVLRIFLADMGLKYKDYVWNDIEIEDVRRRPFSGFLKDFGAKSRYASYKGMELPDEEIKQLSIPKMEYLIEKYVRDEMDKPDSFFFSFLGLRVNDAIKRILSNTSSTEKIDKELGKYGLTRNVKKKKGDIGQEPKTVSYDKPFGDKGQTFASTYQAGTEEQPEFELPSAREKSEEEKMASLDFANKKVYELIKSKNPVRGELFMLRVVGENATDEFAGTTKNNKEIAQMFIDGKLSEETTKFIKDYLMDKIQKQQISQEYTPEIAQQNRSIILDKIKYTFNDIKKSLLTNFANPITEILSQSLSIPIEEAKIRLSSYAARIMGEKSGEKGQISNKLKEQKRAARKLKATITFLIRKKQKIQDYKKATKLINPETFRQFFAGDTYYEKLQNTHSGFTENLMDYITDKKNIQDAAQQLAYFNDQLKDLGDPDALEFANFSGGYDEEKYGKEDLYEGIMLEETDDDNFKFNTYELKKLANDLFFESQIHEARKIIRNTLISEYLKK